MDYSSGYRSKIVVWTVLMVVIIFGASVFASWDIGVLQEKAAVTDTVVAADTMISGEPVEEAVASGAEEKESTLIHLNDWQYVDLQKVRDTWLQWTNYHRVEQLDRSAYSADRRLNSTAQYRSEQSASRGSISHKRSASDGYYNYNGLVQWFKNKGTDLTGSPIVFTNVNRATFSESIGWGYYACSEADCTDEVIEATRSTWNFFYGERSYNGVHYRALTHKNFGLQGLGVAFSGKKYFLTIHYGTKIVE